MKRPQINLRKLKMKHRGPRIKLRNKQKMLSMPKTSIKKKKSLV